MVPERDARLPRGKGRGTEVWGLKRDRLTLPGSAIFPALAFATGCAVYFSSPVEPAAWLAPGFALCAGLAWIGLRGSTRSAAGLMTVLVLFGLAAGVWRSQAHTQAQSRLDVIDTRDRIADFHGWLEAIESDANGRPRLVIRLTALPDEAGQPAARIRVRARPGDLQPGDAISVAAVIAPPRRAPVAGAYDFAFHALYAGLAGTGYAVADPQPGPGLSQDRWERRLASLRWRMAERIRARLPDQSGALAAALLTGDRSGLPPEDTDALRRAGLGHLLAISGMHMALIAGGVFFAVRAAFAACIPWARRHDPARPAAIIAMIAAAGYLALSGGAIPTQRAFIMTLSVLGAVVLGRRALSLHTLALAMLAVLALRPDSIVTPGFQMSFAAVAALIAAADIWQSRKPDPAPFAPFRGLRRFLGGLSMTSAVAGFATAGFSAFHFHRLASFGLLGNLLAMPVFSLLVMPAGALALFLMPLGLDGPALFVMGWGLERVLEIAHFVSGLGGSEQAVAAAPGGWLGVYAAGFAGLVILPRLMKAAGAGVMLVAVLASAFAPRPDLFVSEGAVVVARDEAGGWAVSDRRRDRFAARVFLERQGERQRPARFDWPCDDLGCAGEAAGLQLASLTALDAIAEDCRLNALIVTRRVLPAHIRRQCEALVLDGGHLARRGGALIWTEGGRIHRILQVAPVRPMRPWQQRQG